MYRLCCVIVFAALCCVINATVPTPRGCVDDCRELASGVSECVERCSEYQFLGSDCDDDTFVSGGNFVHRGECAPGLVCKYNIPNSDAPGVCEEEQVSQGWTRRDCECQCSAFRDSSGNGNCNVVDPATGQKWCYLPNGSTCKDRRAHREKIGMQESGKPFSYFACITPLPDSPECTRDIYSGGGGAVIQPGRPFIVQGTSRTTRSVTCSVENLTDTSWKMDQAPSILANNPHNEEIGRRWLENAEAEHASVASFARHTLQLMSIGAPSHLLVASQEASLDEIKHAKMCYGFASAFTGSDFIPGSLDIDEGLEGMDLKEITLSIIQEGCIEETLSAIEANLAAHNSQDAAVKDALSEIASDETNHAQLAWDTILWIIERYPDTRNFVEEAFRASLKQQESNDVPLPPTTLSELFDSELQHEDSEKDGSFRKYGIITRGDRNKLRKAGIRDIIAPVYLDGFKDVSLISKQIRKLSVAAIP